MVDEPVHDDSSYYEISITAGQAFLAVVLLIASLVAAFAFGIVVGQARGKGSPVASSARPPVILEEETDQEGSIVELGVEEEPFTREKPGDRRVETPEVVEEASPLTATPSPSEEAPSPETATGEPVAHVAQILSTTERDPAERLAARLIEAGFTNAYVERVPSEAGMLYRVRVRFSSEAEARAAVGRLAPYAPGEVWVSRAE